MPTTAAASAARTKAPCLRCDGTPGQWIAPNGTAHTCFGCNGLGVVMLTPAGLKARATRASRRITPPPATGRHVNCGHCEDTGRLVNHGQVTGNPCRHC